MPCDLCEIFSVAAGGDGYAKAAMALPSPPLWPHRVTHDTMNVPRMETTAVDVAKRKFEFTIAPQAREDVERIVSQAKRAVCAEALRAANLEVMRALRGVRPEPEARCDIGTLLGLATRLCESHPYPQFPSGIAFLLPSSELAQLLLDHGTHVSLDTSRAAPRVFLNGVEAIAYDDFPDGQREGDEPALAYVMPRHGSVGLALSKVCYRATSKGSHIDFKAHFRVGAGRLSEPVLAALA